MNAITQAKERGKVSKMIFFGLSCLMVVCIAAQLFIAGMAVFTDSAYWRSHVVFVRIFEFIPIVMLIFSFTGRLPKSLRWWSAVLFILIYSQYFTANLAGAGALHPVIASVLLWAALHVTIRTKRMIFAK